MFTFHCLLLLLLHCLKRYILSTILLFSFFIFIPASFSHVFFSQPRLSSRCLTTPHCLPTVLTPHLCSICYLPAVFQFTPTPSSQSFSPHLFSSLRWHRTQPRPFWFHCLHAQHSFYSSPCPFCCFVWYHLHSKPWPLLSNWNFDKTFCNFCWTPQLHPTELLVARYSLQWLPQYLRQRHRFSHPQTIHTTPLLTFLHLSHLLLLSNFLSVECRRRCWCSCGDQNSNWME